MAFAAWWERSEPVTSGSDRAAWPAGVLDLLLVGVDGQPMVSGLDRLGHQVRRERSAAEAVRLLSAGRFDALVTDVDLGEGDGMELVRSVRAASLTLPIVIVSTRSDPGLVIAGLDAGADDFVIRPVPVEILNAHLNALWDRWRGRAVSRPLFRQAGPEATDGARRGPGREGSAGDGPAT